MPQLHTARARRRSATRAPSRHAHVSFWNASNLDSPPLAHCGGPCPLCAIVAAPAASLLAPWPPNARARAAPRARSRSTGSSPRRIFRKTSSGRRAGSPGQRPASYTTLEPVGWRGRRAHRHRPLQCRDRRPHRPRARRETHPARRHDAARDRGATRGRPTANASSSSRTRARSGGSARAATSGCSTSRPGSCASWAGLMPRPRR